MLISKYVIQIVLLLSTIILNCFASPDFSKALTTAESVANLIYQRFQFYNASNFQMITAAANIKK